MAGALDTIVPILLIVIGAVWLWSVFGEPMKRFYEWIKGMTSAGKDRFKAQNPANYTQEFVYR